MFFHHLRKQRQLVRDFHARRTAGRLQALQHRLGALDGALGQTGKLRDLDAIGAIGRAWRDFVQDARLRELVRRALDNNRDLRVATLNIERVRAQYQIQRANQFPSIGLAASGNRQPDGTGGIQSTYSVGLALSTWEIDKQQPMTEVFLAFRYCNLNAHLMVATMPDQDAVAQAVRYASIIQAHIRH